MPHRNSLHDLSLQPRLTGIWQSESFPACFMGAPALWWVSERNATGLKQHYTLHPPLRAEKMRLKSSGDWGGKGRGSPSRGPNRDQHEHCVWWWGQQVPAQRKWVWHRQTVQMWLNRRRNVTNISPKILHWIREAIVQRIMFPLFFLSLNAALTSRLCELFLYFVTCRKDQSDLDSAHNDDLF